VKAGVGWRKGVPVIKPSFGKIELSFKLFEYKSLSFISVKCLFLVQCLSFFCSRLIWEYLEQKGISSELKTNRQVDSFCFLDIWHDVLNLQNQKVLHLQLSNLHIVLHLLSLPPHPFPLLN
jgi:hypothetical protein